MIGNLMLSKSFIKTNEENCFNKRRFKYFETGYRIFHSDAPKHSD